MTVTEVLVSLVKLMGIIVMVLYFMFHSIQQKNKLRSLRKLYNSILCEELTVKQKLSCRLCSLSVQEGEIGMEDHVFTCFF